MNFFVIASVHYFLMREITFDLIDAHTPFHKMRRLEEDLWRHYLRGKPPGSQSPWRLRKFLAVRRTKPILIYHWRVIAKPVIEDFIALASFREPINNLLFYAIIIGLIGALGNAVYNVSVNLLHRAGMPVPDGQLSPILLNFTAIGGLLLLALCLPTIRVLYRASMRWARQLYHWGSDRGR
jgi:hypothetical protein